MRKTMAWGGLIAVAGLAALAAPANASTAARAGGAARAGTAAKASTAVQSGYQFPLPTINLLKSANVQSYAGAGVPITYTYDVTNDGNAPLTNVTVTDPMAGLSAIDCGGGTNVIAQLPIGATQNCTASYTTTQNDVTAGSISNVGTATGTVPGGSTVSYNSSLVIPANQAPIGCKKSMYFDSQAPIGGPETLYYNFSPGGAYSHYSPPYTGTYNAIGFDYSGPYQGFVYALRKIGNQIKLLKFGGGGALMPGYPKTIAGYPTGVPQPVVGAFDPSGNYWIAQRTSTSATTATVAYEINVATPAVINTYTLSQVSSPALGFKPADWTYAQGYLWGLTGHTIYQVSPPGGPTMAVNTFTASAGSYPPYSTGTYGAAWTFGNGNLGFNNNASGRVFEVSPSVTPAEVAGPFLGPQSSTQLNDGTDCAGLDANLNTTGAGPATAAAGSPVSWNLTVTDDGPGDSSGFVLGGATTGAITGLTTTTPGCTVLKDRYLDCAEGELDNGDSYTVTLSGTMPTVAGKCVTTTVTATGDETDTGSGDTTSVQTCTPAGPPTWTVKPGGKFSGKSAVTITDASTGVAITCQTSALTGTLKSGTGLSGTGIGSLTGLSLSGCTGPAGLSLTETSNALPWALNAVSYSGGVTSGTITGIDVTLAGTGCSAALDGTVAGDNGQLDTTYTNSSAQLAVLTTGGNLTFGNVSGCFGLFNNGDSATVSASYALSPSQQMQSP